VISVERGTSGKNSVLFSRNGGRKRSRKTAKRTERNSRGSGLILEPARRKLNKSRRVKPLVRFTLEGGLTRNPRKRNAWGEGYYRKRKEGRTSVTGVCLSGRVERRKSKTRWMPCFHGEIHDLTTTGPLAARGSAGNGRNEDGGGNGGDFLLGDSRG